MFDSVSFVQRKTDKMSNNEQIAEWLACRKNIFYLLYNYVYIPEIGGILKYDEDIMHDKMKQTIRAIYNFHKVILLASRQLGKSTIAAILLEWACNFYPRMPATILNANKTFALENLDKVKFVHNNLPKFLQTPLKYRGERKTTIDYKNGSIIRVFYPSSTTSPDTLARSLTSPILYVDESAHIVHMERAFGAAQPTLSRAREQAKKNNYPYFILTTSTPNGVTGHGEWFYKMWQNSVPSEDLFDENNLVIENSKEIINNPIKNGFVGIKFHWSEDPAKDQDWYLQQKKDLNFDTRMINQELDLIFVGSSNCIFDDDFLGKLKARQSVDTIHIGYGVNFKLFVPRNELDPMDYFLVCVDTAKSLVGDYNALELFSYANFIQIGEYFGKLGSLAKYSDVIINLINILKEFVDDRFILCVENNSIGTGIIENLERADNSDIAYSKLIYSPHPEKYIGLNTNKSTKSIMISHLYDFLLEDPLRISSAELINQFGIIERHAGGSIRAQSGYHDDLFMSCALGAYTRRLSALEYESLLGVSPLLQQQRHAAEISHILSISKPLPRIGSEINVRVSKNRIEYMMDDKKEDDFEQPTDFPFVFI